VAEKAWTERSVAGGVRRQPRRPPPRRPSIAERERRRRRALALIVLGAAILVAGALALRGESEAVAVAVRFARAWAHGDYGAMYAQIDPATRRALSASAFASEYEQAMRTATATSARLAGSPREASGGVVLVPVRVRTRLFGTLALSWQIPVRAASAGELIRWSPSLTFPGVPAGAKLSRHTELPPRAPILARDGTALAEGSPPPGSSEGARYSPLGAVAEAVAGDVGPLPAARRTQLEAEGVPPNAIVGTSGLELAYDARLRGRPGGVLSAGGRILARAAAQPGQALQTTISAAVQRAAVTALGGRLGGVLALDPQSGEVLAAAGLGIDDTQPPGSTFKIVTLTAALESGIATPQSTYPYQTKTVLEGVTLENAGGESCGGTLTLAFAVSCNSVFIPLGVRLGAKRLVEVAEAFGMNHPPGLPGAVTSTIPHASEFSGEVELGSSAIGQGRVLASPLQMATIAATIADNGRRPQPTFTAARARGGLRGPAVMSERVAHEVRTLMKAVVEYGIGGAAAIPGVEVAGKTGTAELSSNPCGGAPEGGGLKQGAGGEGGAAEAGGESCAAKEKRNTDAWFAAFAPAAHPKIAVGVLVVKDGYGGETAAPIAKQVIEADLSPEG